MRKTVARMRRACLLIGLLIADAATKKESAMTRQQARKQAGKQQQPGSRYKERERDLLTRMRGCILRPLLLTSILRTTAAAYDQPEVVDLPHRIGRRRAPSGCMHCADWAGK